MVAVALCLLYVPSVRAALPTAVKACAYSDGTTPEKPCNVDLYYGEFMTYECAAADTPAPPKANAVGGNYCPTPLDDSGNCAKPEALDGDIGTTTVDGRANTIILRLKEDYTEKFKDVIKYHVRCVKSGSKLFVAATLWPFWRPLTKAPRKTCNNTNDPGTTYQIRCNFYIFKSDPAQDFDCRESGKTSTTIPANAYDQGGNVCLTGFSSSAADCNSDSTTPWNTAAKGVVITASNTNQTINIAPSKLSVKRALVFIGCKKQAGGGGGALDMYARGMIFNEDFVKVDDAYVKMIKHVCTPEKGKSIDSPCEVALGPNEAAVMVCTPFVADANYKLMPDDTNTKDGKFCTKKPASFDGDCSETKKWADDAKAVVSMDASMDFFIVALPKANADQLKSQVTGYGYCSNKKTGLAWKVTAGSNGVGTSSSAPGSSDALTDGPSGVAVAMMTLVAASFVAAAAM